MLPRSRTAVPLLAVLVLGAAALVVVVLPVPARGLAPECSGSCYDWASPEGCRQCLDCPDGCDVDSHQKSHLTCVGDYCAYTYTYNCDCSGTANPVPTPRPAPTPTLPDPTPPPVGAAPTAPDAAAPNTPSEPSSTNSTSGSGAAATVSSIVKIGLAGMVAALL